MSDFTSYPDWVRVPTFDFQPLDINDVNVHPGGTGVGFGPFDCTNWASFQAVFYNLAAATEMDVDFSWYSDSTLANLIAERQIFMKATPYSAMVVMPNLGPQLAISLSGLSANLVYTAIGSRSQRTPPTPYVAQAPYCFVPFNQSIAAGANLDTDFQFLWAGPVRYRLAATGQAGLFQLRAVAGGSTIVIHQESIAASGQVDGTLECPEASCTARVTNNGASAANFSLQMWPLVTGAS